MLTLISNVLLAAAPALDQESANPPDSAKVRADWWWPNGNGTRVAVRLEFQDGPLGCNLYCEFNLVGELTTKE